VKASANWIKHTLAEIPLNLDSVLVHGDGLTWDKSAFILLRIDIEGLLLLHDLEKIKITAAAATAACPVLFLKSQNLT